MTGDTIASHVAVRRRYVRSVDLARDIDDPEALDGYVVNPSVRDAATRILAGLSVRSRQRAFRIVGPYGAGKSAFGVFLAQLLKERGQGPATALLSQVTGNRADIPPWRTVSMSGRRVSFAQELLRVVATNCGKLSPPLAQLQARAESMLAQDSVLDPQAVTGLVAEMAMELRRQTGEGLLLLVDEMGRFLEHAAIRLGVEDPSIFQALAERAGGQSGADLAVVGFLHHRFADYVAGMGGWIEAEWSRSSERYEEVTFSGSTEQSLFMLAHALEPRRGHTEAVRRRAEEIYGEAVDLGVFAAPREDVVEAAANLYPLHPSAVAALASATRRFGQNERSLFSFLQSLEPASLKRFSHFASYGQGHWYLAPMVFDHLAATIGENSWGDRTRRWSLALDALANAANLPQDHQNVLKTVALIAVLEPVPGLAASTATIAWSLQTDEIHTQNILDELTKRNLTYRRSHRDDYSMWSSSSVDLSRWLEEARLNVIVPKKLQDVRPGLTSSRPAVAHRHYHSTGTLRIFEVLLWTDKPSRRRQGDGLILILPIYPDEDHSLVVENAAAAVGEDPLTLVCARPVAPEDLRWAHEFALWCWIRDNCEELRLDELARAEVSERIAVAERALTRATAVLSATTGARDETWWFEGKRVDMPPKGLSALLSDICDKAYDRAPIIRNELINRTRLSSAVSSARIRLLDRMLTCSDQVDLGMDGTPPERTIYLSLLKAPGIHGKNEQGVLSFGAPGRQDPYRWKPVWDRLTQLLGSDEPVSFAALMEHLAAPPYGLRAGPALLAMAAFILAFKDDVAFIERNSFQPDLTASHFMRLAKSPANFALKSLHEGPAQSGLVQALATRLKALGSCRPTVTGILEKLFGWYNSLPAYSLKTSSISATAFDVRATLRKASEPGRFLFHDLPYACEALAKDGGINIERFIHALDGALSEIEEATPSLRRRTAGSVLQAFGARDISALRSQLQSDYGPHRLEFGEERLRTFVGRAVNPEFSEDRWLDGIAGFLTGQRPDNWTDDTLRKFDLEIRIVAGKLARWLALARSEQDHGTDLRSVHVVGIDGREEVIVVRRDRPNPLHEEYLSAVRAALGSGPHALEVLGQLMAEYTDDPASHNKCHEAF